MTGRMGLNLISYLSGCLILLSVPQFVLASDDDAFYQSIVTVDDLFQVIDDRALTTRFKDQATFFTHYYSTSLDRSFIVDDELGQVCNTYNGSDIRSCYPCELDEVSKACP